MQSPWNVSRKMFVFQEQNGKWERRFVEVYTSDQKNETVDDERGLRDLL